MINIFKTSNNYSTNLLLYYGTTSAKATAALVLHRNLLLKLLTLIAKNRRKTESETIKIVAAFLLNNKNLAKIAFSNSSENPMQLIIMIAYTLYDYYERYRLLSACKTNICWLIQLERIANPFPTWKLVDCNQIAMLLLVDSTVDLNLIAFVAPEIDIVTNKILLDGVIKFFMSKKLWEKLQHNYNYQIWKNYFNDSYFQFVSLNPAGHNNRFDQKLLDKILIIMFNNYQVLLAKIASVPCHLIILEFSYETVANLALVNLTILNS